MSSGFDPHVVRKDFPILERVIDGKPLVYLDNAATTQKPRQVIEAITDYYEHHNANVHRGIHVLAEEATAAFEGARQTIAGFLGATSTREIVYTRGTTEAINLVAYAWGRAFLKEGDEIVLTQLEHHSNLIPWQLCAQATGAELRYIPVRQDDGLLDVGALDELLTDRTKLVAVSGMSNTLGTIPPVSRIAEAAHAVGALVLVDGAQLVPHAPVDVSSLGADFLAFSGHKMLGPTASGGLWARAELLEAMPPFMGGGEMIRDVQWDSATWNELPWKFEAGTMNIAQEIGLAAAIDYLQALGMDAVRAHERELTGYAIERLTEVGASIVGPTDLDLRGGAVSFTFGEVHPHDLSAVVDAEGVAIRAGHHCTQPLHRLLGLAATARASFYVYNTREDVDVLVDALGTAEGMFA
ncbi:MAG: cysteine desulfurase [Actinomycetota bacterium]